MGGGFRSNGIGGGGLGGIAISNFGNRDEQRQAAMLNTGEFENLFFDTKAMIKEVHAYPFFIHLFPRLLLILI